MKHQTAELEGALLDSAVALARGLKPRIEDGAALPHGNGFYAGRTCVTGGVRFAPSVSWEDGGPLIERHLITISPQAHENGAGTSVHWVAVADVPYGLEDVDGMKAARKWHGRTPLIAAMRAFVASKLGAEVELP